MINEGLVSIIMPIYNVEKFIDRSLNSIIHQTYRNWELLLINDGSTDSSVMICEGYLQQDNRITLFHKNNGGAASARNLGLELSKGKYVLFVDSDDCILDNTLELCVNKLKEDLSDLVLFGMNFVDCDSNLLSSRLHKDLPSKLSTSVALEKIFLSEIDCSICNFFFKRSVIGLVRFKEGRIHEDFYFLFDCFLTKYKISVLKIALYNYLQNRTGSVTSSSNAHRRIDVFLNTLDIYNTCLLKYPELTRVAYIQFIKHGIVNRVLEYYLINNSNRFKPDVSGLLLDEFYSNLKEIFLSKYINIHPKFMLLLILVSPKLYRCYYRVIYSLK